MAQRHDPRSLEEYLQIALSVADDDPFVIDHNLNIEISPEGGRISGEMFCHGDIVVDVDKYFKITTVTGEKFAHTVKYSYHARYQGGASILRYDNAKHHDAHPTPHHKHNFTKGLDELTHVGDDWPLLSDVLDELREMVWQEEKD